MSLRKKSLLGIFWVFAQQFGNQIISFIVSIVLARILMPEDFGLIGMIAVFMAISQVLLNSGLSQSLIRQNNPQQSDYSVVFFYNLGVSIFMYFLLFFLAPAISRFYDQPLLIDIVRVYSLTFVINAFGTVQFTRLTKQMDFKTQMMVSVPSLIVSGLLGVILAFWGFGVWSLVYMAVLQAFLQTLQIWIRSGWIPSLDFNMDQFKYHFSFSYKLGISGLLNTLYGNLYTVVIGKYFAPAQVGFYTRAESMKNLPVSNISSALNKVTFPLFAEIQDDDVRLKRVYKMLMQSVLFVLAPVMAYLIVAAEPIFRLLFTEKWLPAVPYFQILCVSGILYPLHAYNLNILNVKGRSDLFLKLEIIKKFLGVLVIAFSVKYGIIALLWGQLISSFLALFINSFYSGRFINYSFGRQMVDISPILLLTTTIAVVVWMIDKYFLMGFNDIFRILFTGTIGLFLFGSMSHVFRLQAYKEMRSLLKKRRHD